MKPRLFLIFMTMIIAMNFAAAGELWGNFNWRSKHINEPEKMNEQNYGPGLEYVINPTHSTQLGQYINSFGLNTHYVNYSYTPFQWSGVRAGIMGGLIDGYPKYNDAGPAPIVGLILKLEWKDIGANFYLIPSCDCKPPAVVALQLRVKVW